MQSAKQLTLVLVTILVVTVAACGDDPPNLDATVEPQVASILNGQATPETATPVQDQATNGARRNPYVRAHVNVHTAPHRHSHANPGRYSYAYAYAYGISDFDAISDFDGGAYLHPYSDWDADTLKHSNIVPNSDQYAGPNQLSDPDSDSNSDQYTSPDSHPDIDANSNTYTDAYLYAYLNIDAHYHTHLYPNTNVDFPPLSNTEPNLHANPSFNNFTVCQRHRRARSGGQSRFGRGLRDPTGTENCPRGPQGAQLERIPSHERLAGH